MFLNTEDLKSKCPRLCDLHRAYLDQGFGSRSWNIGSEVIGLAGDRVPLHAWPCRNHVRPSLLRRMLRTYKIMICNDRSRY